MTSASASSKAQRQGSFPLQAGQYRRLGRRPDPGQAHVLFFPEAVNQIYEHGHSQLASELGGVLLGHSSTRSGERYVEVKAALPALSEDRGPYHFTFNADVWASLNREREASHPDLQIVGWFHTHPGLGVFFSADDVVVHSAGFSMPWHVALVVDPVRREAGLFGWQDGEVVPLPGFYEVLTEEAARSEDGAAAESQDAFPWRPVRAAVWDETFEERMLDRRNRGPSEIETPAPYPFVPGPWLALGAGIGGVVAALLLLILGILPLYRDSNALEAATLPILAERLNTAEGEGIADCRDPKTRIYAPAAGSTVEVDDNAPLAVVGVASLRDAQRYRLSIKPAGGSEWIELDSLRRGDNLRRLSSAEISGLADGDYDLRLTPLDRQGAMLPGAASCTIQFSLTH